MPTAFPPIPPGDVWGDKLIKAIESRDDDVADAAATDLAVNKAGEATRIATLLETDAAPTTTPFENRARKVAVAEIGKVKKPFEAIYYIPGTLMKHFGWNPLIENMPYKITAIEFTCATAPIGNYIGLRMLVDHIETQTLAVDSRFVRIDISSYPTAVLSRQQLSFEVRQIGSTVPGADLSIRLIGEYL